MRFLFFFLIYLSACGLLHNELPNEKPVLKISEIDTLRRHYDLLSPTLFLSGCLRN